MQGHVNIYMAEPGEQGRNTELVEECNRHTDQCVQCNTFTPYTPEHYDAVLLRGRRVPFKQNRANYMSKFHNMSLGGSSGQTLDEFYLNVHFYTMPPT